MLQSLNSVLEDNYATAEPGKVLVVKDDKLQYKCTVNSTNYPLAPYTGGYTFRYRCIAPVFCVNGRIPGAEDYHISEEIKTLTQFSKFLFPQIAYLAQKYMKDNPKVKPYQLFTTESTFLQEIALPLILRYSSFEGKPIYLSKAAANAVVHQVGMFFCNIARQASDKVKTLNRRLDKREWAAFMDAITSEVINDYAVSFLLFPISAVEVDSLYAEKGMAFSLLTDRKLRFNASCLTYLPILMHDYQRFPDHMIVGKDRIKDEFIISFVFNFQKETAKGLYAFVNHVHENHPYFDYYRYNGKADPFYYPIS